MTARATPPAPSLSTDRQELKYRVAPPAARRLQAQLDGRLGVHRYRGQGANVLPRPASYITTLYFDTPDREVYRRAVRCGEHEKIRAREYYDVHPELLELATDEGQLLRHGELVWLELKRRVGNRSQKHRLGVPRGELAELMARGHAGSHLQSASGALTEAASALSAVRSFRRGLDQPLVPSCLVNYRRTAYEQLDGRLRVTLDRQLSAFTPAADLLEASRPLVRANLGEPVWSEPAVIVEVKLRGPMPVWLSAALQAEAAHPDDYSKFQRATEAMVACDCQPGGPSGVKAADGRARRRRPRPTVAGCFGPVDQSLSTTRFEDLRESGLQCADNTFGCKLAIVDE